ncbi:DUF167 domain-containing protein [Oxalobacter paraformigenes]|uniref:UPF0235 protein OFAG_01819 n=1 Tax=Oxalobacter paraformigenes TaxID=556268 RepID=C3X630_9BURK|nr:DUF167 domain-containing protein [Oxalobacter paraformigenes]EEO28666.1 TIGR00251 family protein [Oxalobacter paraformigenes]
MNVLWLSKTKEGYRIAVQVIPNARKSEIVSSEGETLRIRLQAQPVDGKANEALVQLLAKKLRVPRKQVSITHGLANKRKLLEVIVSDRSQEDIVKQLQPA